MHATRKTCAPLLAALAVHARMAMQILRHTQISVTMNIYSEVSSKETRRRSRSSVPGWIRSRCCISVLYGSQNVGSPG